MTKERKDSLMRAAKTVALFATALLGAWGVADRMGASKLPVARFVLDSARRDAGEAVRDTVLRSIQADVRATSDRVRAIYCRSIPRDQQPGCQ